MYLSRVPRARLDISTRDLLKIIGETGLPTDESGETERIRRFNQAFGNHVGSQYAVTLYRARHAFYFLLKALDFPDGSEILITPIHIPEFVDMIYAANLKPVFVDLKSDNFTMDVADLERKISRNTKAVLVTHLYGLVTNMSELFPIIEGHGLTLLEDCSQCFDGMFDGRQVGTFGKASIYSLSLAKVCSTLNGGVVCMDDPDLHQKVSALARDAKPPSGVSVVSEALINLALDLATKDVIFDRVTFEVLRLLGKLPTGLFSTTTTKRVEQPQPLKPGEIRGYTGVLADLGRVQLARAGQRIRKVCELATFMRRNIADPGILPRLERDEGNVFWQFPVSVGDVNGFRAHLLERGIDTAPLGLPLLTRRFGLEPEKTTPNALARWESTVFLPLHDSFDMAVAQHVVEAVNSYGNLAGGRPWTS